MDRYLLRDLPQGTILVKQLNPDHTYVLPAGKTMCFPFEIQTGYDQVVIDVANTTPFESAWIPGIRTYASRVPQGISLSNTPISSHSSVNPPPSGFRWGFYLNSLINSPDIRPAEVSIAVLGQTTYWMNVINLQNRENYFWCRFTFTGYGVTHVE